MAFGESLEAFFRHCREKMKSETVLVCLGNESCDIDSFVSSLVTAMHERAVFVVNMSRRVLEAKGDVMHMLRHCGIGLDQLVFLERPQGAFSVDARRMGTVFRAGETSTGSRTSEWR